MQKITTICDACGKEIQSGHFRQAKLDFRIDEWAAALSVEGKIFLFKKPTCALNVPISYKGL